MKKYLLKSKIAIVYLVAAIFGVGTLATAAPTVPLESKVQVANVTSGDNAWHDSVNASYDEVVKVSVWIHNPNPIGSGLYASNVNVKINIPNNLATTHAVNSTAGGDNTAVITDVANVTTPVTSKLIFIPGTATRRYNSGNDTNVNFVTVAIPDSIMSSGYTVPRLNPCWNYEEYYTVQARVVVDAVSITKQVRTAGQTTWLTDSIANPGDTLEYQITTKNNGNENLTNVIVWDSLPSGITYVPGSTKIRNGTYPNGSSLPDGITSGGINIGTYAPSAVAYVLFQAKVLTSLANNACGNVTYSNVGNVRSDQMNPFNASARTVVNFPCAPSRYTITSFKYEDINGDGNKNTNEGPVSNWPMTLTGNGVNVTQNTGADG
ncbi:MAG: DUF11 domain-containing protein, partial [bacterium]